MKNEVCTPNNVYVSEYKGGNEFGGDSHFVIVIAASDIETARVHVKKLIGFDTPPTYLMGASYPTIYNRQGDTPLKVQAKILSNNNYHTYK